jgi:hypothetical protein
VTVRFERVGEATEARIEELEAEVARLKLAQTSYVIHSHYHYTQPVYLSQTMWGYPQLPLGQGTYGVTAGACVARKTTIELGGMPHGEHPQGLNKFVGDDHKARYRPAPSTALTDGP